MFLLTTNKGLPCDANASRDQDLANSSQVQDSVPNLSPTLMVHEEQNWVKDACQGLSMTSRYYVGNKEAKTTTRNNSIHLEMGTDSRSQTKAFPVDQQTLLSPLNADPYHPNPDQGWDVTFALGPNHLGPKISLIDHVAS